MCLLYISGTYAPQAFAGSELSAHTLLKDLAGAHKVEVLVATDLRYVAEGREFYDGLKLKGISHETRVTEIRETIRTFSPDVILTQPWWHDVALRLGRELGIPTIFRVTDWSALTPISLLTENPCSPSEIIVQTKEAAQALRSAGRESTLLPAFIDLSRAQSSYPKHRKFITMFNPVEEKGGFVFWTIAKSLQDMLFAIVPGWWSLRDESGNFDKELFRRGFESQGRVYDGWVPIEPDFRSLNNITILHPRDMVAEIFDQTRILLVPSSWKEPFARVIFEAAANGAAVIASGIDSLRDNAGDAAMFVEDFRSVSAWIEAIRQLDDPIQYAERSKRGQEYVLQNYDLGSIVAKFFSLAQKVVSRGSASDCQEPVFEHDGNVGATSERGAHIAQSTEMVAPLEAELVQSREMITSLEAELVQSREMITSLEAELTRARKIVALIYASTSWRITAPLRSVARLVRRMRRKRFDRESVTGRPILLGLVSAARQRWREKGYLRLIASTTMFNRDWYLEHNPDVRAAGIDPALHYLRYGAREGRDPSPQFDSDWYLAENPDVAKIGFNPLVHYLQHGVEEGRAPIGSRMPGINLNRTAHQRFELPALLSRHVPQKEFATDILACIYTCEQHRAFLDEFYRSVVGRHLLALPDCAILEVYADSNIQRSLHRGNTLVLRATEIYENLPLKTYEMIRYCVQHFQFRRMLKIDVTVVKTRFEGTEYDEGRAPLDLEALVRFLTQSPADKDYNGLILHARTSREHAMAWAATKRLSIHYERLFGDGPIVPYFSGKCYFLSREFADFISQHDAAIAREHVEYLPGAEDVMIGRLYREFEISNRREGQTEGMASR
jgi:glycosyltransferase involved in cell wall biosynthesis